MTNSRWQRIERLRQIAQNRIRQLTEVLYWIDGRGSNMFLCVEPDGLTLVDAGFPKREMLILEGIAALGYTRRDLKRVVITHADVDHVGSLAAVQRATGCRVYASEETAEYLQTGRSPEHLPWLMQRVVDRLYQFDIVDGAAIHTVKDGETLPVFGGLETIASPGHTSDHHAFFSGQHGVMFTGDVINTRKGPLHTSEDRISINPRQVIRSARRILSYSPAIIACGHGAPLTDHSAGQLMSFYNELRQKEAKLL